MMTTLAGVDERDLDEQIQAWRAANPPLKFTKIHSHEMLAGKVSARRWGEKIEAQHQMSVRFEYESA